MVHNIISLANIAIEGNHLPTPQPPAPEVASHDQTPSWVDSFNVLAPESPSIP
jgi:hypothetical protein